MNEDALDPLPIIKPEDLEPVARDQFAFAFKLSNCAAGLATPVQNPGLNKLNIVDEEKDEVTVIQFTDIPVNRAMFAAKGHFGNDEKSFLNFSMRFFAMGDIIKSEEVKEWMKPDEKNETFSLLHHAVIYAEAETPLDSEGGFNKDKFFKIVKEISLEIGDDEP